MAEPFEETTNLLAAWREAALEAQQFAGDSPVLRAQAWESLTEVTLAISLVSYVKETGGVTMLAKGMLCAIRAMAPAVVLPDKGDRQERVNA